MDTSLQELEDIQTADKCEAWPTLGKPCWQPAEWMAIKACGCSLLVCDMHKRDIERDYAYDNSPAGCVLCNAKDVPLSARWIKL